MSTMPVVTLQEIEPAIALITMQERTYKNTFSEALIAELVEVFRQVGADPRYKAAILTGYESYFASGGTQEGMLAIEAGKIQFTDLNLYSVALDCPIPVISAMQGHGIGGGLALGLFADFIVMSRESIYTTNFMKYGFTPGMGATLIVPEKLGMVLGTEMLMSAKTYRGEELKERGVGFPILPRAQVLPHAIELARTLADKPRLSLTTLKQHLTASLRARLPSVIAQEVAMHDITFHQPEVKERIASLFGK